MRSPHEPALLTHLRDSHRALHRPKMRIGERNVHRLQRQRMTQLAPVRRDHVGRRRQARRLAKLRHDLAARKPFLRAAGILGIRQDVLFSRAQPHRLVERPRAIRIERDARRREALGERRDRFDLNFAATHPALELEIIEAVARLRCFRQAHDRRRRHRLFVPEAQPIIVRLRFFAIAEVGLFFVRDIKKVTQHLDLLPLLPRTQQRRHRHLQKLPVQIEHRRLDCRHRVNRRAQIEGLLPTPARVPIPETDPHRLDHRRTRVDRPADDQLSRIFQRLPDLLSTRHLSDPGPPRIVGQQNNVAREKRSVRAA